MLKEIFTSQRQFINRFFEEVNQDDAERVIAEFLKCRGMIVLTGVGKSGLIAEKIAATLVSTGTRAIYLPPINALHGDIGILSKEDLVVILSKTGKSDEVLALANAVRERGIRSMAWTSLGFSPLSKVVDETIHLPVEREICPFDLSPTTSCAVQLIFGDIVAVALMKEREFNLARYAMNHPAGGIGKLIARRVEEVMVKGAELPLCHKTDKLKDVLVELSKKRCGCLLVVDSEMKMEGIFTDGDLRRALEREQGKVLDLSMEELMVRPFLFTTPKTLTSEVLKLMEGDRKVTMLPVLEGRKVVGLIHIHNIVG